MANYNRVILAGNMTRDPELSYTPSNTPVCKFGIAVNRTWTDRQTNVKREETMFIDCTAWSRSAEVINQYCSKGKPILLEGRLVLDTWTNQEGQKRSKHTVTVDNFQFLGSPGGARSAAPESAPASSADVPDQPPGPDDAPF
ncbi:MAG: single-stranded DNA-binding protein [Phycisphaerae bacterium]